MTKNMNMKPAIIIIDLQKGLFDQPGKPFDYENVISNINNVSQIARDKDLPVIFIQHETTEEVLRFETAGWKLVDELTVSPSDYIVRKTTPNSFLKTNLHEILQKEGVNSLVVCGYATEFCVDSTVRAAAALGYPVNIVSDGHTTHDKVHISAEAIRTHHNETLSNMRSFGVEIKAIKSNELIKVISK